MVRYDWHENTNFNECSQRELRYITRKLNRLVRYQSYDVLKRVTQRTLKRAETELERQMASIYEYLDDHELEKRRAKWLARWKRGRKGAESNFLSAQTEIDRRKTADNPRHSQEMPETPYLKYGWLTYNEKSGAYIMHASLAFAEDFVRERYTYYDNYIATNRYSTNCKVYGWDNEKTEWVVFATHRKGDRA